MGVELRALFAPVCHSMWCISVPLQMHGRTRITSHTRTHTLVHKQRYLSTQQPATKTPKITGTCCSNHNVYSEAKLERFLGNSNFSHKPQQRPRKQLGLNNVAECVAGKQSACVCTGSTPPSF